MREIDPAMAGEKPQDCFAVRLKRIADQLGHYIDRGAPVREAKPREWRLRETPWVYSPAVPILFIVARELAAVIESLGLLAVPTVPSDRAADHDAGGKLIRLVSRGPMLRRYASDPRRALIALALGVRSDGGGRR